MEEKPEVVVDIDRNMNEVKGALIGFARANNSPAVQNVVRQFCDNFDVSYLLYRSLLGIVQAQNEQIEEKVAAGNVVQFPGKAPDALEA